MTKKTTKKTERESPFAETFRGPWTTAEAAQVGEIDAPIVRNWIARSSDSVAPDQRVLQGRSYFWTRDVEPEREQRLRELAIEMRTRLSADGMDDMRITDKIARLMREPGEVVTAELVETFVLAELTRCGLSPGRARKVKLGKAELVEQLTRDLFERAYGKLEVRDREGPRRLPPEGASSGPLLIAEAQAGDEPPDLLYVERDDLVEYLSDEKNPAATRIAIDTAKLFRRLVARVEKVKAARPAEPEPKP
jgi:hypothetical protein